MLLGALLLLSLCAFAAGEPKRTLFEPHVRPADRIVVAHRDVDDLPRGWSLAGGARPTRVDDDIPVHFVLVLHPAAGARERVLKTLEAVSDPASPEYRRFRTRDEMTAMAAAPAHAVDAVRRWLASEGLAGPHVRLEGGDQLRVRAPAGTVRRLFATDVHFFHKATPGSDAPRTRIRHVGPLSLPRHVEPHVRLVLGLSEMLPATAQVDMRSRDMVVLHARDVNNDGDLVPTSRDFALTPAAVRKQYNVPANFVNLNEKNSQSIVAFNATFDADRLRGFHAMMGIHGADSWIESVNTANELDENEADLDLQYLTSIGKGVSATAVWNYDEDLWIYEWAAQAKAAASVPHVAVLTSALSEATACPASGGGGAKGCAHFSYDSAAYVKAADDLFAQLGARGMSIIVAAGDDGPIGDSDNCPIHGATGSKCNALRIERNGKTCTYPQQARNCPHDLLGSQNCVDALSTFATMLQVAPCSGYISYTNSTLGAVNRAELGKDGGVVLYSNCTCAAIPPQTINDCTVSGLDTPVEADKPYFRATWPGSSPHVTSVGATQLSHQPTPACADTSAGKVACPVGEQAASRAHGNTFTSAGGFSHVFKNTASYQRAVVDEYLSDMGAQLPPAGYFDRKGRAFPDVAAVGTNCLFLGQDETLHAVDGTSCAAPIFGGLVSLLNGYMLDRDEAPLGFLNPFLYAMAVNNPESFNSIPTGNSCCSRNFCAAHCLPPSAGPWDPLTGLGSLNVGEVLGYLARGENKGGDTPAGGDTPPTGTDDEPVPGAGGNGTAPAAATPTADLLLERGDVLLQADPVIVNVPVAERATSADVWALFPLLVYMPCGLFVFLAIVLMAMFSGKAAAKAKEMT